jgi:predicted metal-binding membrane protein
MPDASPLELVLRRDRWAVLAALAGVTVIAWAYLTQMAGDMHAMAMPAMTAWSPLDAWLMFVMWAAISSTSGASET